MFQQSGGRLDALFGFATSQDETQLIIPFSDNPHDKLAHEAIADVNDAIALQRSVLPEALVTRPDYKIWRQCLPLSWSRHFTARK